MLLHSSRIIKGTWELNKPNSRKIILGKILVPTKALGKGLQNLNGSLSVPLNTT